MIKPPLTAWLVLWNKLKIRTVFVNQIQLFINYLTNHYSNTSVRKPKNLIGVLNLLPYIIYSVTVNDNFA